MLIVVVIVVLVALLVWQAQRSKQRAAIALADALADARQVNERLGGQVYSLTGGNEAATQALADASERHLAAGAQLDQAHTPVQARLAKQTALEGLYYIRAARTAMSMDPGPAIAALDGQNIAGQVSEKRVVRYEGRQIAAAPEPSSATPNYYPGGRVAGRPVPAGWYSEPWWKPALVGGAWGLGSALLFTSLFSGMSGVGYDAHGFESGYGEGYQDGLAADHGGGYDQGGDYSGGTDGGGFNSGGFDGGGGFNGGF
ncbi:DUF1542 domain-containing protein [Nocardia sp. NBC_00508]|uniref:DUF1542 domain-containing protein n=1 Tax=Nocardia sp. NBC_00508 TaxID=2975992 RepID=UPI002E8168C2|nr:DUF1542 domain-containing protein [Nocardia sp. NBC_00508]WUD69812.1 DUF1542 domain-containing protein [Nocardia sp. NBC_00508]